MKKDPLKRRTLAKVNCRIFPKTVKTVENSQSLFNVSYTDILTLLGSKRCDEHILLDIGHLYAVWEGDPSEVIARAAPHLAQVHLEDHCRGVHEHLLPGTGDVDFASVLRSIHESVYDGAVCVELSRQSHCAPTAVATCSELWSRFLTISDR